MKRVGKISSEFSPDGQMLTVHADVAGGWRRFPKGGFGFCEDVRVDLKGDCRVRVHLKLEARGAGMPEKEALSKGVSGKQAGHYFKALLDKGRATLSIDLLTAHAGHLPGGKRGAHEGPSTIAGWHGLRYDFSFLVVFTPPPRFHTDIREWDLLPFLPGGLPETDRRRF